MANTHETTADIIAWLCKPREGENAYLTLWRDEIADRLEAARKRERGNAAKLREALEELVANIEMRSSTFGLNVMVDTKTYLDAKTALAAPPRNCDVGTAEEQADMRKEATSER